MRPGRVGALDPRDGRRSENVGRSAGGGRGRGWSGRSGKTAGDGRSASGTVRNPSRIIGGNRRLREGRGRSGPAANPRVERPAF